jgi:hypothetical protein
MTSFDNRECCLFSRLDDCHFRRLDIRIPGTESFLQCTKSKAGYSRLPLVL